jgi:hypothetical protein
MEETNNTIVSKDIENEFLLFEPNPNISPNPKEVLKKEFVILK